MIEGERTGGRGGEGVRQATGQREWEKVKDIYICMYIFIYIKANMIGGEKRKRECAEVERKRGRAGGREREGETERDGDNNENEGADDEKECPLCSLSSPFLSFLLLIYEEEYGKRREGKGKESERAERGRNPLVFAQLSSSM